MAGLLDVVNTIGKLDEEVAGIQVQLQQVSDPGTLLWLRGRLASVEDRLATLEKEKLLYMEQARGVTHMSYGMIHAGCQRSMLPPCCNSNTILCNRMPCTQQR